MKITLQEKKTHSLTTLDDVCPGTVFYYQTNPRHLYMVVSELTKNKDGSKTVPVVRLGENPLNEDWDEDVDDDGDVMQIEHHRSLAEPIIVVEAELKITPE